MQVHSMGSCILLDNFHYGSNIRHVRENLCLWTHVETGISWPECPIWDRRQTFLATSVAWVENIVLMGEIFGISSMRHVMPLFSYEIRPFSNFLPLYYMSKLWSKDTLVIEMDNNRLEFVELHQKDGSSFDLRFWFIIWFLHNSMHIKFGFIFAK